jgi:ABC-type transport system involved in multi-copper enzyme maturation permease subunit
MTDTMTPYRSGLESGRDGFRQLLRAEWTKFRTVRGWLIGIGVAALVTVLMGLLGPAGSSINCVGQNGNTTCPTPSFPIGPGGTAVADNLYFVHQPLAGDGSITVRVTSLTGRIAPLAPGPRPPDGVQPWAKAGIMIKANTTPGSAYAAVMVTGGHGDRLQYDYTQDTAGLTGTVGPASPRWLRLTRAGDIITGYDSADGTHWNTIGTATLAGLPSTVQAGLFAASPDYQITSVSFGSTTGNSGPTEDTAQLDSVRRQGTWPVGAWSGTDVDGPDGGLNVGFQQADGVFTVTGSGDVAPLGAGDGGRTRTIENGLVGVFAGLIAMIVVAALFVAAEYRRGLIRTTFAASPRRGRVLAAKAVVIGAVAFVTGLVAGVIAIPLVEQLERAKGLYVFPVPALTELRVVVGTAALLAVAAVLAMSVGAILRRGAGAVTAVIAAIVLPYILAVAVLPTGPAQWLLRVTPAAGFAIQQSIPRYSQVDGFYAPTNGYFPLSPLAGFAVLCGYTVVALGLAVLLVRRRDA